MAEGAHSHDYALNKSGIIAWTHAASYYGRYGVRVNTLCPGGLASDRTPARFSKTTASTQLGRLANEYDIRGPLLFLALMLRLTLRVCLFRLSADIPVFSTRHIH